MSRIRMWYVLCGAYTNRSMLYIYMIQFDTYEWPNAQSHWDAVCVCEYVSHETVSHKRNRFQLYVRLYMRAFFWEITSIDTSIWFKRLIYIYMWISFYKCAVFFQHRSRCCCFFPMVVFIPFILQWTRLLFHTLKSYTNGLNVNGFSNSIHSRIQYWLRFELVALWAKKKTGSRIDKLRNRRMNIQRKSIEIIR